MSGHNCCCSCCTKGDNNCCPCTCNTYRLNYSALGCNSWLIGGEYPLTSQGGCSWALTVGNATYTLSYCKNKDQWFLDVVATPGNGYTAGASFTLVSDKAQGCVGPIPFKTIQNFTSTGGCPQPDPTTWSILDGCCQGSVCDFPTVTLELTAAGCPCIPGGICLCGCCDCMCAVGGTYVFGPGNLSQTVSIPGNCGSCCDCSCYPHPVILDPTCIASCWFTVALIPLAYCSISNMTGETTWGWSVDVGLYSCINFCANHPGSELTYCGVSTAIGAKMDCGSSGSAPLGQLISGCTVCSITGGSLSW